jgi:CubicO group peptidase (beta-lactamase class C family)
MEDVAGKPYPEILRERVLAPAGMTHSTYVQPLPRARENEAATAYASDGSAIEGRYHNYPEIGAAGLWTTAEDLARFVLAIQQARAGVPGALLSPRLVKEMLTPGLQHWGLGPWLSEDGQRFGHSGANEGFRSNLCASLDDGWGIVVLTNGEGGGPLSHRVLMTAAKEYGWSGFDPIRRTRVDIGEAALARVAGTYECLSEWSHARSRLALFPTMGTLEFRAVDGRLIADVPEGAGTEGRVEFLPQSEFRFMQRRNGLLLEFTVEDGQVTGFTFRGFEAKRIDE